jgi:glycyl-tRNA synthetase (class II)
VLVERDVHFDQAQNVGHAYTPYDELGTLY